MSPTTDTTLTRLSTNFLFHIQTFSISEFHCISINFCLNPGHKPNAFLLERCLLVMR